MPQKKATSITVVLAIIIVAIIVTTAAVTALFDPLGLITDSNAVSSPDEVSYVQVPILMYHHFAETDLGHPGMVMSGETFANHLGALQNAGYTTISFAELRDFVYEGRPLPKRPIIITFDDGYLSNYEIAFPILKQHNMSATVFIIGVTHAREYYKDTEHVLRWPRFDDDQAVRMVDSGHIFIESHSYDMHQHEPWEKPEHFRRGVLRKESESEKEYIYAFRADFKRSAAQIEALTGVRPFVYSYPFGISNELSDYLLEDMGVKVTLKITPGINIVTRGDPDSLMSMNRFNVPWSTTPEELIEMIG